MNDAVIFATDAFALDVAALAFCGALAFFCFRRALRALFVGKVGGFLLGTLVGGLVLVAAGGALPESWATPFYAFCGGTYCGAIGAFADYRKRFWNGETTTRGAAIARGAVVFVFSFAVCYFALLAIGR